MIDDDTRFWDELAIDSYKSLLKKKPNSLMYNNLALAYVRINRDNKAIRALQKAIKCDKNFLDAHYHLGVLYQKNNKPDLAKRCFKAYNKLLRIIYPQHDRPSIVRDMLNKLLVEQ